MVPRGTFPAGELVIATPQGAPPLLSLTCTVGVEEGEGERGEVGERERGGRGRRVRRGGREVREKRVKREEMEAR